jgi:hypothetical protein
MIMVHVISVRELMRTPLLIIVFVPVNAVHSYFLKNQIPLVLSGEVGVGAGWGEDTKS